MTAKQRYATFMLRLLAGFIQASVYLISSLHRWEIGIRHDTFETKNWKYSFGRILKECSARHIVQYGPARN